MDKIKSLTRPTSTFIFGAVCLAVLEIVVPQVATEIIALGNKAKAKFGL